MDFINMTSTGKATIEVDVKKYNQMLLDCHKLNLLECGGVDNWEGYAVSFFPDYFLDYDSRFEVDGEVYFGFYSYKKQMERANNFKE